MDQKMKEINQGPFLRRSILNKEINFPICLAPMVGLTHVALREVIRSYLPSNARTIWPTEMLNSRRIPNENLLKTPETIRGADEDYLVPQILGNEEYAIRDSVKKLIEWGACGIDINMGCSVQKALKHNYGVSLMGDPHYAAEVVAMAVRYSRVPVSVKLRAAGSAQSFDIRVLVNFVLGIQDAGASWVCLHPRTADQKRRGSADWTQIKELRNEIKIPLIGNGDIQTAHDVNEMLRQTECDMVMSGRALAARPWMLWQLGELWGFDSPVGKSEMKAPQNSLEEGAEYGRCLQKLIRLCAYYFGEELALRKVRFYIKTTSVWIVFGQTLISESMKAQTIKELIEKMNIFFDQPIEMIQYTHLRQ